MTITLEGTPNAVKGDVRHTAREHRSTGHPCTAARSRPSLSCRCSSAMRIAATPEDFVVEELPLYAPAGEGAHTFVRVEKRLRTTEEVARALARLAGVRPGDVGYAGRKDRVAVARQWL